MTWGSCLISSRAIKLTTMRKMMLLYILLFWWSVMHCYKSCMIWSYRFYYYLSLNLFNASPAPAMIFAASGCSQYTITCPLPSTPSSAGPALTSFTSLHVASSAATSTSPVSSVARRNRPNFLQVFYTYSQIINQVYKIKYWLILWLLRKRLISFAISKALYSYFYTVLIQNTDKRKYRLFLLQFPLLCVRFKN